MKHAALLGLSLLALAACQDDFFHPARSGPASLIVAYSRAVTSQALVPDRVHVQVTRSTTSLYDSIIPFNPGGEARVRINLELSADAETVDVLLELLEGTNLIARGAQQVELKRGQTTTTSLLADQVHDNLSVADGHGCYLSAEGDAYCWGMNQFGQLGIGGTVSTSRPVRIAGGNKFVSISAGVYHTCALTESGEAFCWGQNGLGRTGIGVTSGTSDIPMAVSTSLRFNQISAGLVHTCALTATRELYCWGDSSQGQLGSQALSAVPVPVHASMRFDAIQSGFWSSCALSSADTYCWGALISSLVPPVTAVTRLGGSNSFQSISVGIAHACGVTAAGAAHCWGGNNPGPTTPYAYGQLGNGTLGGSVAPVPVGGGLVFSRISASRPNSFLGGHTCALTTTGAAYCWGLNRFGQLGNNASTSTCQWGTGYTNMTCHPLPLPVSGGNTFTSIAAGNEYSCGLTTAGRVYCWGSGASGVLGRGSLANSITPVWIGNPLSSAPIVNSLSLTAAQLTLAVGDSVTANASAQDQNANVLPQMFTWTSSDSTVVRALASALGTTPPPQNSPNSRGMLIGVAPGTSTITVSTGGRSTSVVVNVVTPMTVRNDYTGAVTISAGSAQHFLNPGESVALHSATAITVSVWDCGEPGGCKWDPYVLQPSRDYSVISHPSGPVTNLAIVQR